jgi:hypothetical protein
VSLDTCIRTCVIWLVMIAMAAAVSPLLPTPSVAQTSAPNTPYVLPTAPVPNAVLPQQPQAWVDTTFAPPTGGQTWTVPAGGDFQAALNNAHPGDVIVLQAGAKYYGNFTLPYKTGTGWIYIESSALASLPAPGTRVTPAQASLMPQIIDTTGNPAIQTATAAHNYRLVGLEITTTSTAGSSNPYLALVILESPGGNTSLGQVPTNIVLDRSYIHGTPTGNIKNGVIINGAYLAVVDSYISDIHAVNNESHGIAGWNGPCPCKISDNEVQAAGQSVLFADGPEIPNLVPSDIEVRGNHLDKLLTWLPSSPTYAGIPWAIKNDFELKNAARVLVDGNVMEHSWPGNYQAEDGFCVLLTVRDSNNATWSTVEDVTFTHNVLWQCSAGIMFLGRDYIGPSQEQQRLLIQNNLLADIGPYSNLWTAGLFFQVTDGGANYVIDHNTAFNTSYPAAGDPIYAQVNQASSWPATGFVFTNNIVYGSPGVCGDNVGCGIPALNTYFPDAVFLDNVLVGGSSSNYPDDNFFPPSFLDAASFAYRHAGTDRRAIGADLDALAAVLRRSSP